MVKRDSILLKGVQDEFKVVKSLVFLLSQEAVFADELKLVFVSSDVLAVSSDRLVLLHVLEYFN